MIEVLRQWANGYKIENFSDNSKLIIHSTDDHKSGLSGILKAESGINAQLNKAFEAFETGIYDAETFRNRSQVLKTRLAEINIKKIELQHNIDKVIENEKIISEFIPKTQNVVTAYEMLLDAHNKNNMLKQIIDHIDYNKDTRGHGHEEDFTITVYPKLPKV